MLIKTSQLPPYDLPSQNSIWCSQVWACEIYCETKFNIIKWLFVRISQWTEMTYDRHKNEKWQEKKRLVWSTNVTTKKQWRIQDFPEQGVPTPEGRALGHTIWQIVPEHCMKIKKFWPTEEGTHVLQAPIQIRHWEEQWALAPQTITWIQNFYFDYRTNYCIFKEIQ